MNIYPSLNGPPRIEPTMAEYDEMERSWRRRQDKFEENELRERARRRMQDK